MRRIRLSDTGLEALATGPEGGTVALCLHGFPDTAETFRHLQQALAERGFLAVAPCLRGYAPSTLEGPVDLEALTRDALAWADFLSSDRPIVLIGHDWGAAIAHAALALRPERVQAAVIMSVPHPVCFARNGLSTGSQLRRSWYMGFFQLGAIADAFVARDGCAFVERLWREWSPGFEPPREHIDLVRKTIHESLPRPLDYYRETARAMLKSTALLSTMSGADVTAPVLYLHGQRDGCIGSEIAEGQVRFYGRALEQVIVPSAGHFLHLEARELVQARILAFLGWAARYEPAE